MMKYSLSAIAILALGACGGADKASTGEPASPTQVTASTVTSDRFAFADELNAAVNGEWRAEKDRARDSWRNPAETLAFFGIEPDDTVIEIWPGRGWYTSILAPYLNGGGGSLIAAVWDIENMSEDRQPRYEKALDTFKTFYASKPDLYGSIQFSALSDKSGPLGESDSVDVVLTFRNVHNWMANGYEAKVFQDAYAVLKPGGVLGVVEHRLASSDMQDPEAKSGYVHEDYVKALAENAGFEFAGASDINANPADEANHPFGVWTLPPVSRTKDRDGNTPDGFQAGKYLAIGESDRMTLKFVKPEANG